MRTVEGIVTKVLSQPSKYGRGQLYTVLLCDDSGNEHGVYYNFGPTKPPCDVGDKVRLGVEFQGAKRAKFVEGQGEMIAKGVGVPSRGGNGGGGSTGGGQSRSRYDDPKTQQSINYQSSRKDALQLLAIALQYEALPLGSSKGKRFEELKAQLRKLTAELYQDLQNIDATLKATAEGKPPAEAAGQLPDRDEVPPTNDDEITMDEAEVADDPPWGDSAGGGKF